jgi:hypothetical protein
MMAAAFHENAPVDQELGVRRHASPILGIALASLPHRE